MAPIYFSTGNRGIGAVINGDNKKMLVTGSSCCCWLIEILMPDGPSATILLQIDHQILKSVTNISNLSPDELSVTNIVTNILKLRNE